MTFTDFWTIWPHKRNKHQAQKAFGKLRPEERQLAVERAEQWCREWRKENPQASHIHASTYLSQRRFLDADEHDKNVALHLDEMALRFYADWVKDGHFLARTIKPNTVAAMVQRGLVTEDQCRRAGVA